MSNDDKFQLLMYRILVFTDLFNSFGFVCLTKIEEGSEHFQQITSKIPVRGINLEAC